MTFSQDLAAVFAETEATAPVQLVRTGATARGFVDVGVEIQSGDITIAGASDVLHLLRAALPGVRMDDQVRIGSVGAAAVAEDDPLYVVRGPVSMNDDGAFNHLAIVEV